MSDVAPKSRGKPVALAGALVVSAIVAAAIVGRLSDDTGSELEAAHPPRNSEGFSGLVFVNHAMTWDQANHWCRSHGAQLATSDSPDKAERIRRAAPGRSVWIGYRSLGPNPVDRASYRWQSGAPWNGWLNWAPHEPNNLPHLPHEWCGEQYPDKRWNNLRCNDHHWRRPFVCDRSPYYYGWAVHGANPPGVNYDEANDRCRLWYGTGLATPGNPDQMRHMVQTAEVPRAWIGLRLTPGLPFHVNHFRSLSGKPTPPLRWGPGEPNNWGNGEECGEIHPNGLLNDMPCHARFRNFICDRWGAHEAWTFSSFELMAERGPFGNWRIPAKVINFHGRRRYSFYMDIRINGLAPVWTSIMHVGTHNEIRQPAIWLFPSHERRLHFRQRGRVGPVLHWNHGCSPRIDQTPGMHHWFQAQIEADTNRFAVRYNGHLLCQVHFDIEAHGGNQPVFVGDPWHPPAPISYRAMRLNVF